MKRSKVKGMVLPVRSAPVSDEHPSLPKKTFERVCVVLKMKTPSYRINHRIVTMDKCAQHLIMRFDADREDYVLTAVSSLLYPAEDGLSIEFPEGDTLTEIYTQLDRKRIAVTDVHMYPI